MFARAVVTESSTNQTREKPPPKWGGVCEITGFESILPLPFRRNPHRSGEVFASLSIYNQLPIGRRPYSLRETPTKVGRCLRGNQLVYQVAFAARETPTEVGSTVTYHQVVNVLAPL